ncbi:hypothetical protein ACSNOI_03900 [Actinomadura kijaniata]|uniref:hypothetical protein n=1 Tax=Actinomadura kijaniata TaxID=46161 RepID=UPI003F1953D4
MERAQVKVGTVYKWSDNDLPTHVFRILIVDADIAMCDNWWPHLNSWGLADLGKTRRQRITLGPTPISTIMRKGTYLRTEPLTEAEAALFRPDLPFSVMRCAAMQWPETVPPTAAQLAELWSKAGGMETGRDVALKASEICLYPFGPKGGEKPGARLAADNGTAFTVDELLRKAATLQASHLRDVPPTQGIGLHRAGLTRGVPSYYLWGYQSQLHTYLIDSERRKARRNQPTTQP